jgi:hypothetical protein
MSRGVDIERLTIRLPHGWQGDPVQLARQLAEQLQRQAADLGSARQLDLALRGPFAGVSGRAAERLGPALTAQIRKSRTGGEGR